MRTFYPIISENVGFNILKVHIQDLNYEFESRFDVYDNTSLNYVKSLLFDVESHRLIENYNFYEKQKEREKD